MKYSFLFFGSLILFSSVVFGAGPTCPAGQYRVKGHFRRGYIRSNGTVVKPTSVRSYCKMLSKAYEFSKERFKKGLPSGWPHIIEKAGAWTDEERERVVEALEDLPDILLSDKVDGLYRLKRSKDYPNPASSSDGILVIYDSAFDSSRNLAEILAHELSHQNFLSLSDKEQQDYRRATGWHMKLEPNGIIDWEGRKDGYIEEDGKISYQEDYANNLEHYLYDPDKLKEITPSAYNWIRKHFGGDFRLKGQKK